MPTCPDWRVRDLLLHTGGVHRWAASFLLDGTRRPSSADDAFFVAPAEEELVSWYRASHAALVDVLLAADPDTACWAFLPAPSPLAFWARRQAHETLIHRVDAESAAGEVTPVDPDLADDGIDELLNGFFGRPRGRLVADPPVTLALVANDTPAAWAVRIEADRRVVTAGARDGDCVVAGPIAELYLLLWNRRGPDGLDVQGDRGVLDLWRAKARVTWS